MKAIWLCMCAIVIGVIGFGYDTYAASDTTTVAVPATYYQTDARRMYQMINDFRTSSTEAWYWNEDNTTKTVYNAGNNAKLGTLTYDYDLEAIAMQRAVEIALSWGHTRPNGQRCFTATSNNARSYGENVAIGYSSVEAVFTGWQETAEAYAGQGHRRNMLNKGFKSVGIGYAVVNGVKCWVQEFAYQTYNTASVGDRDGKKSVDVEVSNSNLSSVNVVPSCTIVSGIVGREIELPTVDTTIVLNDTWKYVGKVPVTTEYQWTVKNVDVAKIENGKLIGVSDGTTQLTATVLGKEVSVTVNILLQEEKEHTYNSGEVTKEPTCIEKGIKTYTCTGCGDTYTEEIPALGHTLEIIPAVSATTTTTGLTQGSRCSVCRVVITPQKIFPKLTVSSGSDSGKDQTTQNQTSQNPSTTTESELTTKTAQSSKVEDVDEEDGNEVWEEKDIEDGNYGEYDNLAEVGTVKKTQITTVNAVKKGFTIKWKRVAKACNGYEVSYSTKKSMKNAKSVRLASNTKSFKAKRLKAKKTYYVRIRTYRIVKVNGSYKRVYSRWSKLKTVRTR